MTAKLYLGDAIEVMSGLPAGGIDAVITDIPYGSTRCRWDIVIPLDLMWQQVKRVLKPRGVFVTTATQPFLSTLIVSNLKWFKYCWYWKKERGTGFATSAKRPLNIVEEVAVFGPTPGTYNAQRAKLDKPYRHAFPIVRSDSGGKDTLHSMKNTGERIYKTYEYSTPHTLLEFPRDRGGRGVHPTQKPLALFKYLVLVYSNEGDTILDFAMGSGTTAVACIGANRNFIGCDNDAGYFAIEQKRIEQAQMSLLEIAR